MIDALKTILHHNLLGLITTIGLPALFLVGAAYTDWYAAREAKSADSRKQPSA